MAYCPVGAVSVDIICYNSCTWTESVVVVALGVRLGGNVMSKWLEFSEPTPSKSGLTNIWAVYSSGYKDDEGELDKDCWLGEIKWRGPWRKYAFFPERDTLYEADCLRDIAQFCEDRTKEHKEAKRNELHNGRRGG